ncbi:hypothetical protein [Sedimentitalea sp.]|uniref:DUF6958 family protein n=1 Tax=Sedimentitalea sp. TaxID=2048915 RepID=UPI003297C262
MAMRETLLSVLPREARYVRGRSKGGAVEKPVAGRVSRGGKAVWRLKAVQLDLEVNGVIKRGGKGTD